MFFFQVQWINDQKIQILSSNIRKKARKHTDICCTITKIYLSCRFHIKSCNLAVKWTMKQTGLLGPYYCLCLIIIKHLTYSTSIVYLRLIIYNRHTYNTYVLPTMFGSSWRTPGASWLWMVGREATSNKQSRPIMFTASRTFAGSCDC